jgi:acetoin utilization deacetylase AcuC-like enzyme
MSFRVRRIYDDFLPSNKRAIDQIIEMTKTRVADLPEDQFEQLRGLFRNPIYRRMRYIFFIADDERGDVKGFAQMSFAPDIRFSFLDLLVARKKKMEGGMGSVLYERVREEARYLKSKGLFIECMTDDGRVFKDRRVLKENRSRMKFYELYGARPIINTLYEQHTRLHYSNPYFLLYDDLDQQKDLCLEEGKKIVKAVLERKYEDQRKRDINAVLRSMKDDPVQLRDIRYKKTETVHSIKAIPDDRKIILVTSDGHEIHHVRERGYVESPVRIRLIQNELEKTHLFQKIKTRHYSERYIKEVHEDEFVNFFKRVSLTIEPGKTLYPDVFPIRKIVKPPKGLISRAGYYCTDVYSPINRNSYLAARAAVNSALTGAEAILAGMRIAYALVRPPGHHADSSSFGGFCYFNSTAVAAQYLSRYGKVVILDLDYHHGNGQQDIFYLRQTVLTISIHADPDFEYPHFSGFKDEIGKGAGEGFNINYPLPAGMTGGPYHRTLKRAARDIRRFDPDFLVVALGFDTAKGDPTGTWKLASADFKTSGRIIGGLGLPTLVVQEGGYNTRMLGINARNFFTGLWEEMYD